MKPTTVGIERRPEVIIRFPRQPREKQNVNEIVHIKELADKRKHIILWLLCLLALSIFLNICLWLLASHFWTEIQMHKYTHHAGYVQSTEVNEYGIY